MKKLLAILLTLTLALGMLVACGDKEEAKDEGSTASEEEQVSKDEASDESSEDSSADSSEESSADSSEESVEDGSSEESVDDRVKENPAEFVGTWYGNSYNTVGETLTINADGTGNSVYVYGENSFVEEFDWYVIDGEFYYYFYETEEDEAMEVGTEQTMIDAENGTFSHVIVNLYEALYSYSTTKPELGGDDSLFGSWATEDGAYIFSFYEDGTGDIETEDDYHYFVWTADTENAYLVTYFDAGTEESYTYSASEAGVSLITNGEVFNLAPYEYSYKEDEPIIDPNQTLGGDNNLVGTWMSDDDPSTITLKADGTGNFSMEGEGDSEVKWFAENGSLTIVVEWEGFEMSLVAGGEYSIDGNRLTITEGMGEYTLTKV